MRRAPLSSDNSCYSHDLKRILSVVAILSTEVLVSTTLVHFSRDFRDLNKTSQLLLSPASVVGTIVMDLSVIQSVCP